MRLHSLIIIFSVFPSFASGLSWQLLSVERDDMSSKRMGVGMGWGQQFDLEPLTRCHLESFFF